jgi:hypothetical protein
MRHLSIEERVDLVESGDPQDHPHLRECAQCREEVEALRATLRRATDVDLPEPSPLFWAHFSDRVARAIAEDGVRPPEAADQAGAAPWWRWRVVLPLIAVVATLVVGVALTRPSWPGGVTSVIETPSGSGQMVAETPVAETDDAAWRLVTQMASDVDVEAVSESTVAPATGMVDGAVWQLSARERTELARLLRAELDRAPSVDEP